MRSTPGDKGGQCNNNEKYDFSFDCHAGFAVMVKIS
jgi:hypothetical protein